MSAELIDQLQSAVDEAHIQGARLLIFKGSGKSFCAGFDLSNLNESSEADLLNRFVRIELLLQSIANSPCLTLALVQGKVFGAGVDLVAVCKERVASNDVVFRMPGLKFGLVLGTRRFGEIVGIENARSILQVTSNFDAKQALDLKFIHSCAQPDNWTEIVDMAKEKSIFLDRHTQAMFYDVFNDPIIKRDRDLSTLVRSAARKGLKERLYAYINDKK